MDELIDIYDENMNQLGTAMKSQAHQEGLWHKAFHCWLVKEVNGKIFVWMQLRNEDKDIHPNMLDTSAAGHVKAGEEVKDGYREIKEELGIDINKDDLIKMFTCKEIYQKGRVNNQEFHSIYLGIIDKKIEDARLQPEEVAGLYEIEVDDLINLMKHKVSFIPAVGIKRNNDNTYSKEARSVRFEDIAPHGEAYYLKVMEMIKRHFKVD